VSDENTVLSVESPSVENSKLVLYPNPASETIKIRFPKNLDTNTHTLFLYTIIGEKLMQTKMSDNFDVSNLKKGMYLLRLEGRNTSISEKFVVK